MFARCGKWLVIILLVLTTGTHWLALQTVAWTTMLAANLTISSLSQAVSDTFDGEHPCPLCKTVAAGKKAEKESEATAPVLKMEYPPVTDQIALFAPAAFSLLPQANIFADSLSHKPPLPPPRSFFV
jgi:hypothetical protein